MRRVVVTGVGLVTPLGAGREANWERLTHGQSGVRAIQHFDVTDLPAKIAGLVPKGANDPHYFNMDAVVSVKDRRRMDDFIVYAIGAAAEAVTDAGWTPEDEDRASAPA